MPPCNAGDRRDTPIRKNADVSLVIIREKNMEEAEIEKPIMLNSKGSDAELAMG